MRSEPLNNPPQAKTRAPQLGMVRGATIERAFIGLLYTLALALALLSLFGTFYGLQGRDAPLAQPWTMVIDGVAAPSWLAGAFALQVVLTLAQWGARQLAKRGARWWLLYLAALGLSVYYNVVAYYDPALALGVPWLVALLLIVGGDAAPEFTVVRD